MPSLSESKLSWFFMTNTEKYQKILREKISLLQIDTEKKESLVSFCAVLQNLHGQKDLLPARGFQSYRR